MRAGREFLRQALVDVEREFLGNLERKRRAITHNTTLGDAVEEAWITLLKTYLPARYCVAKAFAIDHQGRATDQLDCLIYDAHFTPALFGKDHHLYVPAEAVYATFEIKQFVTAAHLEAAAKKAKSVRALARTSAPIPWANGVNPPKRPFPIVAGLLAMRTKWRDGLGRRFLQQFERWSGTGELDLVLTADAGFCDRFSKAHRVVTGEGSLVRGLFRLLYALREKATVTAIEWDKYEAVLWRRQHRPRFRNAYRDSHPVASHPPSLPWPRLGKTTWDSSRGGTHAKHRVTNPSRRRRVGSRVTPQVS